MNLPLDDYYQHLYSAIEKKINCGHALEHFDFSGTQVVMINLSYA